MMGPPFNEAKTTQAAAYLLRLRGGQMSYMKLIKLLYLVDRETLLRWGRPVTGDRYVSLPHGPVLSRTLDLIAEGPEPNASSVWSEHISPPENYDVRLVKPASTDQLSEAEIEVTREIFERYGRTRRWELVRLLHERLAEWQDPGAGAMPIAYQDILRAGHKTELEICAIEGDLENLALVDSLLPEP